MNSILSSQRFVRVLGVVAAVLVAAFAGSVAFDVAALPLFAGAAAALMLLVLVGDYAPRPALASVVSERVASKRPERHALAA
jgi:hypothetical protein